MSRARSRRSALAWPRRRAASVAVLAAVAVMTGGLDVARAPQAAPALAATPAAASSGAALLARPDLPSAQSAARIEGTRVLIESETTETSKTYAEPNGTLTTESNPVPVRVRQGDGWIDIDPTLVARDGKVQPRVAKARLDLSAGGGDPAGGAPLVTFGDDKGRSLTWRWPGQLPAPVLDGPVATYKDAAPGVDLTVEATRTGFKDSVVLTRPPAKDQAVWRFPLKNTGLTAAELGDGRIAFTDADGKQVAVSAPALMWDAQRDKTTGDPLRTAPVTTEVITGKNGAQEIRLTPQAGFLTDPQTVYPVTVDPATHLGQLNDHWVSKDMRTGATATYNSSASPAEIRAGYYAGGYTKHYGYLHFDSNPISAQYINTAKLNLYQHNTITTCSGGGTHIYGLTNGFNDSTTWASRPIPATTVTSMLGGCVTGWYGYDVVNLVKGWAGGTTANYGMQLRAGDDAQTHSFWRFHGQNAANAAYIPSLAVNYNRPPNVPTSLAPVTGTRVKSTTPTLSALVSDPDLQQLTGRFFIIDRNTGITVVNGGIGSQVANGQRSSFTVPAGRLVNDGSYVWSARGHDGVELGSGTVELALTVDTTGVGPTAASASAYTNGQWNTQGPATTFTFSTDVNDTVDANRFNWRLDNGPVQTVTATVSGGKATGTTATQNPSSGWHTLNVQALDAAGNAGPNTQFTFGARAGLTSPRAGDATSAEADLAAVGPASNGVHYEYMLAGGTTWTQIPPAHVTSNGTALASWPAPVTVVGAEYRSSGLRWDVARTLENAPASGNTAVTLRAVFTSAGAFVADTHDANNPVAITYSPSGLGTAHATEDVGPGTVDLLTGNVAVSATDADLDSFGAGLSLSRTHNSRQPNLAGPFGPGWTTSLASDDTDWTALTDNGSGLVLTDTDALQYVFSLSNGTYRPVGEALLAQLKITRASDESQRFTLADPSGVKVDFTPPNGTLSGSASVANPHLYKPAAVVQPGSAATTTYTYKNGLPIRVLAPLPTTTTTCTDAQWDPGCRALELTYSGSLITSAAVKAFDPATSTAQTVPVACYAYTDGRLTQQWDPRLTGRSDCLDATDAEPVGYAYDQGRIVEVRPAGLKPWTLRYDSSDRLTTVSRTRNDGTAETTTLAYKANIGPAVAGDDSHPDLTAGNVARWAQSTAPASATAVFGPGTDTSDLRNSTVHALDTSGRELNTASFSGTGQAGWKIHTSEYDPDGNLTRTLTPGSRDLALDPNAGDPQLGLPGDTAGRARALDTTNLYTRRSDNLFDLEHTFGPAHMVTLPDGTWRAARAHTATTFGSDIGQDPAPGNTRLTSDAPQHHPKRTSSGASLSLTATPGTDADVRTTEVFYALSNNGTGDAEGWPLKAPIKTVTWPTPGDEIVRIDRYDPTTGLQTQRRMPTDTAGIGPGTTVTTYYDHGSRNDAACVNSAWKNLVCKTGPASQPTDGPPLPGTHTTYDLLLRPIAVTETVAGAPDRISTTAYQHKHSPRVSRTAVTGGLGTPLPAVVHQYDPATGLPVEQSHEGTATTIKTGYDEFGRQTRYTNADGDTTTTSYDTRGRVARTSNAQNTLTYAYDAGTERRGLVTSVTASAVSTTTAFTGAYNADGQLTRQIMPDGLEQHFAYDESSDVRTVRYTRNGATLLTDSQTSSIHGQWRTHAGYASSQSYAYDNTGRLTSVDDTVGTVAGSPCTRRSYDFDDNSNRLSRTTHNAEPTTGKCISTAGSTTDTSQHDSADRLQATGAHAGLIHDAYGRITNLPAGSSGTAAATGIGYYNTDWVRELRTDGKTRTWELDPAGRRRTMTEGTAVTRSHYDSSDDNPAWIGEPNGTVSIYTSGLNGSLAAVTAGGSTAYQLVNLHGDIATTVSAGTNTLTASQDADEYGKPRNGSTPRYGWLGAYQRSGEALGGLLLMGVRLYSPNLGRFLSVDPVVGGNANAYEYCTGDPINCLDLDGRAGWGRKTWNWTKRNKWQIAGAALSFVPVAGQISMAYRAYKAAKFVHSSGRFGGALFRSKRFGAHSRLFGDVHRGAAASGRWNSRLVRVGWSAQGSRSLGLGKGSARAVFRVGIGSYHRTVAYGKWL